MIAMEWIYSCAMELPNNMQMLQRLIATALLSTLLPALGSAQPIRVVPRGEIVEAMGRQRALGYDILATSHGSRFTGGLLLDLTRRWAGNGTAPFLLNHHDYFEALLQVTGLTRDKAPSFARLADDFGEDQLVDPRPENVIRRVAEGQTPKLAVNVIAGWRSGAKDEYSYDDLSATPHMRVVHKRVTSYRLIDLGDALLFDEVSGYLGRPMDGLLGAMFKMIGNGAPARSMMAFTSDGTAVTRTTANKGMVSITETATVMPNGRGQKGVPADRPDLAKLEERLKQPFRAVYVPLSQDPDHWPKP